MDNKDTLVKKIEAILFLKGEPVNIGFITRHVKAAEDAVRDAAAALGERLKRENSGLRLVTNGDNYMLATAPELEEVAMALGEEELNPEISKAALEVLTIVIYRGPLSKPEVDYIRGVNSVFTIRSLLVRGLIEKEPKEDDRRTFFYKPSISLLRHIGVTEIGDLPEYDIINKKLEEIIKNGEKFAENPDIGDDSL